MAFLAANEFRGLDSRRSSSSSSWQNNYSDTFREVKRLYFRRQYRQCAALCYGNLASPEDELHPVQRAVLLFFAGISYDTLARSMPNCSPSILGTIDEAESLLQRAADALPDLSRHTTSLEHQTIDEEDDDDDSALSPSSPGSCRSDSSSPPLTPSTTATSLFDTQSDGVNDLFRLQSFQFPVPPPKPLDLSLALTVGPFSLDSPFPSPLATTFAPYQSTSPSKPTILSCPTSTDRYNAHLASLHLTISQHLASLDSFRTTVLRARDREACFARRAAATAGRAMTPEEKMERIRRGRERGWVRKRFDRERYERLAERALEELGP